MWLRSAETSLGLHGNVHQNIYSCGPSVARCSNQSTYHVAEVEQGRATLQKYNSGHLDPDASLNHEK